MTTPYYSPPTLPPELNQLQDYLEWLHNLVAGIGQTTDGSLTSSNAPGLHSGDNGHEDLLPATDVDDVSVSSELVTEPDADVTYGAEEQTLINEIKSVLNSIISEYNAKVTADNARNDNLRNSNILG